MMPTVTLTLRAECDVLGDTELDQRMDDLCETAENLLADILLDADASFQVEAAWTLTI